MSTFNHPNTAAAAPSSQTLSSPENVRSIFYTNLILLGIQEHASQTAYNAPPPLDTSRGLSKSLLATSQIHAGTSRLQHQQPAQQQSQHILITSHGYGTNISRPLELHKCVFAKGHQSTKALEFVLWFLFTRLDKTQARDRFKECWPVLDRHDAREFRNVAFKWLDELRKEGCFGVGHNIHPTKCHVAGLGLFLPTIRRSYLDDSIGERIERLVLVLSTYVLSQVAMYEVRRSKHSQSQQMSSLEHEQSARDDDKVVSDLVCKAPEIPQEEDSLLSTIDSYIVQRSEIFGQDMESQENARRTWSSKSNEMSLKLHTLARELVCHCPARTRIIDAPFAAADVHKYDLTTWPFRLEWKLSGKRSSPFWRNCRASLRVELPSPKSTLLRLSRSGNGRCQRLKETVRLHL
ncbi:HAUS augmin-like complex subunit 6 N-terminus-domain-containing protein [Dissophora ornata]|nr:HAUS augmin-like complex subunit 6 N-terminus-domain-containing protein [Dissophora ornata]